MRNIGRNSFLILPFCFELLRSVPLCSSTNPAQNSAPSKFFYEESDDESGFSDIPREYFDKLSQEEIQELVDSVRSIFPKDQKSLRQKATDQLKHLDEEQLQELKFEIEDTDLSKLGESTEELLDTVEDLMKEGRIFKSSKSLFKDILLEEDLLDTETSDQEQTPYEESWEEETEIDTQWNDWTNDSADESEAELPDLETDGISSFHQNQDYQTEEQNGKVEDFDLSLSDSEQFLQNSFIEDEEDNEISFKTEQTEEGIGILSSDEISQEEAFSIETSTEEQEDQVVIEDMDIEDGKAIQTDLADQATKSTDEEINISDTSGTANLNIPDPPLELDEKLDLSKDSAWVSKKQSAQNIGAKMYRKTIIDLALELKEEANQMHRNKDFHGAITTYEDCCLVLEEATTATAKSVLRSCKLSLALCYLKVEEYENAEAECTEILQMGAPKAVQQKAFYRRAKARDSLGLSALAYRDLKKASELGADDTVSKLIAKMQEAHGTSIVEDAENLSDEEEYPLLVESNDAASPFPFGKGSNNMMNGLFGNSGSGGPMGDMSNLMDLAGKMGTGLGPGGMAGGLGSLLGAGKNGTGPGLLSTIGNMLEKPETQSMICNFLKGAKPEAIKSMGSMAGINLSDSAASRLHQTLTKLEPHNIGKMVKAAKITSSVMKKMRQVGNMIKKSRPFLIYGIILIWLYASFKSLYPSNSNVLTKIE